MAKRNAKRFSPFLRQGFPFITLCIGGYLGIGYIVQGRRDIEAAKDAEDWEVLRQTKGLSKDILNDPKRNKVLDLEEELTRLKRKVDLNNFEYKPVPRTKDQ